MGVELVLAVGVELVLAGGGEAALVPAGGDVGWCSAGIGSLLID